jgi:hypothetical protein
MQTGVPRCSLRKTLYSQVPGASLMSEKPKPKFDPVKLEQLKVAQDYPLESEEFEMLLRENAYCEMGHVNGRGYPVVTPMFYVIKDDHIMMTKWATS